MTKRVPLEEKRRPRRQLGNALRGLLSCPLCGAPRSDAQRLRIVAYRDKTVRFECSECDLRFSIDVLRFVLATHRKPDRIVAGMRPEDAAMTAIVAGLWEEGKGPEVLLPLIESLGAQAFEAHLRGIDRWEPWLDACKAGIDDAVDTGDADPEDHHARNDGVVDTSAA